jgi:hypothetical protein
MKTRVALRLDSLRCIEETEHGSEPYVWPVMITHETGALKMRVPTTDWAARVLADEMKAGQSVAVPEGMDLNFLEVFDDKAAALVVFVIILFEKDNLTKKGRIAGFRHVEEKALEMVGEKLAECRQSSGERVDLTNDLIHRLDIETAVKDAMSYLEIGTAYSLPGGFDDALGIIAWTLSGQALVSRGIDFRLRQPSERFLLSGRLEVSITLRPVCENERAAAEQTLAVVKGLQGQRAALQHQLQHATPQQKPGLIAAIKRINEVDLPPAEAALAQAEAALNACLSARDIDGPLDDPVNDPIG